MRKMFLNANTRTRFACTWKYRDMNYVKSESDAPYPIHWHWWTHVNVAIWNMHRSGDRKRKLYLWLKRFFHTFFSVPRVVWGSLRFGCAPSLAQLVQHIRIEVSAKCGPPPCNLLFVLSKLRCVPALVELLKPGATEKAPVHKQPIRGVARDGSYV